MGFDGSDLGFGLGREGLFLVDGFVVDVVVVVVFLLMMTSCACAVIAVRHNDANRQKIFMYFIVIVF